MKIIQIYLIQYLEHLVISSHLKYMVRISKQKMVAA